MALAIVGLQSLGQVFHQFMTKRPTRPVLRYSTNSLLFDNLNHASLSGFQNTLVVDAFHRYQKNSLDFHLSHSPLLCYNDYIYISERVTKSCPKKILVLHTGGTISMQADATGAVVTGQENPHEPMFQSTWRWGSCPRHNLPSLYQTPTLCLHSIIR